jgi:hypothetical protein
VTVRSDIAGDLVTTLDRPARQRRRTTQRHISLRANQRGERSRDVATPRGLADTRVAADIACRARAVRLQGFNRNVEACTPEDKIVL